MGITLPAASRIPESRIAALARLANRGKVTLITRMPPARRLATLAAFVHSLEATAQDDVLEVLEILLHELFGDAEKADKKARLRTLKDLDEAAATRVLLDPALPDNRVRRRVFEKIPQPLLERAVENVDALIRPPGDVFYKELDARYAAVWRYLPMVLKHVRFEASPAGKPVVQAYDWLRDNIHGRAAGHQPRPARRLRSDPYDPQRPGVRKRAGGQGWSTPLLHSWFVQRDDGLILRALSPNFALTPKLQHHRWENPKSWR